MRRLAALPTLFALNRTLLDASLRASNRDDPRVAPALQSLRWAAATAAQAPIVTVVQGPLAPSGNVHDYLSLSPYAWPCNTPGVATTTVCNKTTGLPWVQR